MLSSDTRTTRTLNSIQALRGIAALLVVFHHACLCFADYGAQHSFLASHIGLREIGACGVDVFFVISGFIMVVITTRKPPSQRLFTPFVAQRVFRIAPLYWIYTTCLVLLLPLPFVFVNNKSYYTWSYILQSYLFIPALNPRGLLHPLLDQGWTLFYEMLFYLVFAVFLRTKTSIAVTCISALFICLVIAGAIINPKDAISVFITDSIILEFCLGMLAGIIFLQTSELSASIALSLFVASVAAFVATLVWKTGTEYRVVYWGLPAFGLLLSTAQLEKQRVLTLWPKQLLAIGDSSYSIYLTHAFLLLPTGWLLKRSALTSGYADAALLFVFAACIVPGLASYIFVEKPLTKTLQMTVLSKLTNNGKPRK